MSISMRFGALAALAAVAIAAPLAAGSATAAPLTTAQSAVADQGPSNVQEVRHRRWGGGGFAFYGPGIYIGPRYGGYYSGYYGYPAYRDYGYYDDGYYPRYRYSDRYYDRPYRKYGRRWTKERFEHPLGRR